MTFLRTAVCTAALACIVSATTPATAFEPRSDDMANVGATLTVVSGIGLGISAGMLMGVGDVPDRLPATALVSVISTVVGSVGVPLWIVGAGPDESVTPYPGDEESRSTTMGAIGIIMTAAGVGTLAGTMALAADIGSQGELSTLGAGFASAVGVPTGAAFITMGIPLIVKGFHSEPDLPATVPTVAVGPGSFTASWAF